MQSPSDLSAEPNDQGVIDMHEGETSRNIHVALDAVKNSNNLLMRSIQTGDVNGLRSGLRRLRAGRSKLITAVRGVNLTPSRARRVHQA